MMTRLILLAILTLLPWAGILFVVDVLVYAQAPISQPTVAPDVEQVLTQIHQVGCNAEAQASAQTIAQLQKENASLKAQIQKLDPPKSGATKH